MSVLKQAAGFLAAPFTGGGLLMQSGSGGQNPADAFLSGIPFIGEGFAAQQQQGFNRDMMHEQMSFNSAQSAKQMAFQEKMANSAHQRQVADLRAAGLNPILSANSGASSPSGSAATSSAATGSMGSGAASSANILKSIMNKERQLADSEIQKKESEIGFNAAATKVQHAQEDLTKNSARAAKADADLKELQLPGAKNMSKFETEYGESSLKANKLLDIILKGSNSAGSIIDLLTPFKGMLSSPKKPIGIH